MEKTDESAPPLTFHFAPEIEQAMVSLCFYAPERIAVLKRELDVEVHFTRPELRYILEAIQLAYCELGQSDFASVITTLRELGRLAHCGGVEAVNAVFQQYRYGFSCPQAEEEIFAHYLQMLKAYALAREQTPGGPPIYHFAGGKGTTVPNKVKRYPGDPDEIGRALIAGKPYAVSLWRAPEFTNLRFSPTT